LKIIFMKAKKCKICNTEFSPFNSLQIVCSIPCAIKHAEGTATKKMRQEIRHAKEAIKTRQDWLKEVQTVFNRYIRARDKHEPCISCGRNHQGQYHAGHYLSVGARPELRFDELNCHKQCAPCNNYLSGNIALYRLALVKKIGQHKVDWLEGSHEPKKYSIEDLRQLKQLYKTKLKEIENGKA